MSEYSTTGLELSLEDVSSGYRTIVSDIFKEFPDSLKIAFGLSSRELKALTWIPKDRRKRVTAEMFESEQDFTRVHFACLHRWMLSNQVFDRIGSWLLVKRGGFTVPPKRKTPIHLDGDNSVSRVADVFDGDLSFEELEMNFSGDPFSFFVCDCAVDQLTGILGEGFYEGPHLNARKIVFFIKEFDYTGWVVVMNKNLHIDL